MHIPMECRYYNEVLKFRKYGYGGAGWFFSRVLKDDRNFRCLSNFAREVFSERTRVNGGRHRTQWTVGQEQFSHQWAYRAVREDSMLIVVFRVHVSCCLFVGGLFRIQLVVAKLRSLLCHIYCPIELQFSTNPLLGQGTNLLKIGDN